MRRRKRDDDSSFGVGGNENFSTCSQMSSNPSLSLALEVSSMSQAGGDSRRHSKRRRTIVDALQSISLDRSEEDVPDQIVQMENDNNHSLTSSSDDSEEEEQLLLSDVEKAQRAVMLELVFGNNLSITQRPEPQNHPLITQSNPVDAKIESLIRESLLKAVKGENPMPTTSSTQDDMTIDPSYSRASSGTDDFVFSSPRRPRSNSLPMDSVEDEPDVNMDMGS
jgi:hypothetical protein